MIPDPLHPSVVHFPIVLILLGTLVLVVSLFTRNRHVLSVACGLLILSAITAYFAEQTGSDAYDAFKNAFPHAENILDTHADNATWTVRFAIITAVLSFLAAVLKNTKTRKVLHISAAVMAIVLTYSMYNTARLGGEMVYGDALGLSGSNMSKTLEKSEHTHEGPNAHVH